MLAPCDYQLLDKVIDILCSSDTETISVLRLDVNVFHDRLLRDDEDDHETD